MAQTGCDGIMIGRGLQGNPWLISQILHGTPKPDISEIVAMILRHARMQIEMSGEYLGIRQMRKHVAWYGRLSGILETSGDGQSGGELCGSGRTLKGI